MNEIPHRSSLVLVDAIGTRITVYANTPQELRALQREYGRRGYRPEGEIPCGGLQLPYAQHDTFDWSLIGATPWTSPDGDRGVIHDGSFYKLRELEAVDSRKMKLPQALKYSRGARETDPEHLVEEGSGEFKYRTLIMFRGGGKAMPEFSLPGGQRQRHAVGPAQENAAD
ncbi:single-stranded DNA-binding protein [Deinococcus xianganensis]|uniref:Uncharacterized protein n=1 Tax=Deinococcus xianganensis TaxID=1507289 RepID=A0A6I4YMU4_9DEIO|nr:single-stranded DNA-binding protein [Deinococcus xianganensis]MXV21186.1 hypothetical protein [Deinococcus xianganensis]